MAIAYSVSCLLIILPVLYYIAGRRGPVTTRDLWIRFFTEQEQVELSVCVVGSNPNALAKAWQAGAIDQADIETLSREYSQRENGRAADCPAPAAPAREQARRRFLEELQKAMEQKEEEL